MDLGLKAKMRKNKPRPQYQVKLFEKDRVVRDIVQVPKGTIKAGTKFYFFKNGQGQNESDYLGGSYQKTYYHTNLENQEAGTTSGESILDIDGIVTKLEPNETDFQKFLEAQCFITLNVDGNPIERYALSEFFYTNSEVRQNYKQLRRFRKAFSLGFANSGKSLKKTKFDIVIETTKDITTTVDTGLSVGLIAIEKKVI